ncbi:MAG TPA: chemotaxis protein CheX [Anaerolineaceae bacterium]|nr:chemotaxis protein CheX [Anaerolineaceae bacterium]
MSTNVRFLNPFVEAATEVLQAEVGISVGRGNLTLQKSGLTTDDVTVLINLVGEIEGVVLYGMSFATGINLVSGMLGQPFEEFDNLAQSGVAELGNVISGKATMKLSDAGIVSTISTPTLIIGNSVQISTLDFSRIVVPLTTDMGVIVVHLAVRETPEGQRGGGFVPLIRGINSK